MSLVLALGLTVIGAIGCIYVLFFAGRVQLLMGGGAGLFLGVGLVWLYSDFIDATPNEKQ